MLQFTYTIIKQEKEFQQTTFFFQEKKKSVALSSYETS